jgi:hypothetical protein
MQKSLSSSFLLLSLLSLFNLFQFTYSLCWEQAFVNNTVFINTLTTGRVQMGHVSQINKLNIPTNNNIPSGMPKITAQLLKEKCDKLGVKICAAIQIYQGPGTWGDDNLSLDWGNLLTLQEYKATRKQGTIFLFILFSSSLFSFLLIVMLNIIIIFIIILIIMIIFFIIFLILIIIIFT